MICISNNHDNYCGIRDPEHLNANNSILMQTENIASHRQRNFPPRNKKMTLKIDMTPMVDLGVLLITFFVFTSTISDPTVTDLFMPNDKQVKDSTTLADSNALTVLLDDNNKIYYYQGGWEKAKNSNNIFKTNYSVSSGLGSIIRNKQREFDGNKKFPEGRKGLMLLIKPFSLAAYRNVIDALDEILINEVRKYAIIEPSDGEIVFLKRKK